MVQGGEGAPSVLVGVLVDEQLNALRKIEGFELQGDGLGSGGLEAQTPDAGAIGGRLPASRGAEAGRGGNQHSAAQGARAGGSVLGGEHGQVRGGQEMGGRRGRDPVHGLGGPWSRSQGTEPGTRGSGWRFYCDGGPGAGEAPLEAGRALANFVGSVQARRVFIVP